jgi:hypothetical protein
VSGGLRVLTVWQPWASLIIAGAKPYEFRSRKPPRTIVGQRIVIHAGMAKMEDTWIRLCLSNFKKRTSINADEVASTCLDPDKAIPILEAALRGELPRGAGLGTAVCGEGRNGLDIAEEFGLKRVNDSDRDQHANYGWPMTEIEQWPEAIPARGSQGIWFWPTLEGVGL